MRNPRAILITGASSGIGAALALDYAAPGVTLFLNGRDAGRLDTVAQACAARGADVRPMILDVTDAEGCARWIAECDALSPLDLVIANAGISGMSGNAPIAGESPDAVRRVFAVNLGGTLNTILPAIARMRPRQRGQIGIVSSLASFVSSPGFGAYSGSKAAQRLLGESLRAQLSPEGIAVSVICPGFIRTPMTAGHDFPMPFLMDVEPAARIIRNGLARNRARIAFPLPMYLFAWLGAALPPALSERVTRRFRQRD